MKQRLLALFIILAICLAPFFLKAANPPPPPQPSGSFQYTHANTITTGTSKSGPGMVHTVTINTKGATSNILTLFDNTAASGTTVAVIDTTSQIQTIVLDAWFQTGISWQISAGTAADVTITWN